MSDNRAIVDYDDDDDGRFVGSFRSDLMVAKGDAPVVHLFITKEPVKRRRRRLPLTKDHHAFVFNHDLHICGVCKLEFVDVVQFLLHKTEHSLGKDFFECDLCKLIVSSKELLIKHYDNDHQLPSNQKCSSELENGNVSLSEEKSVIANGNSVESAPPEALHLAPPVLEYQPASNSNKSNNGKRKSKLQVKPMLESGLLEDVVEQPSLFDEDFQKLNGTREFNDFAMSDQKDESNDNDSDFAQVAMTVADDEIGTEESCASRKARNGKTTEPFDFLHVPENATRSRFSHARSWLQCPHCDYRARRQSLLTGHLAKLHKNLEGRPQNVDSHVKQNPLHGQKAIRTPTYETTLGSGKRGLRSKHQRFLDKPDISGTYPCSICGKLFIRFRYLRKHLETHQTEKAFACEDCGKSFNSRAYLRVHRRVHLQKKEFSCNQCNFVSSINAAIHAHRQIHNSGSVICDICGYAYTDRSTLGKHKRVHDLSRPFACNFPGCKWRFKTEVMCRAHFKAHTTQGKFRCAVCGYVFRHKHHLQRHELHMHRVKTDGVQLPARRFSAAGPKEFPVHEDPDQFLPITDLDMPQDLSPNLPAEFDQSQDSGELPVTFIPSDLSIINVDCELLNIDDLNTKEEDDKHVLISELEVFN